jgi:hypothetical protein
MSRHDSVEEFPQYFRAKSDEVYGHTHPDLIADIRIPTSKAEYRLQHLSMLFRAWNEIKDPWVRRCAQLHIIKEQVKLLNHGNIS